MENTLLHKINKRYLKIARVVATLLDEQTPGPGLENITKLKNLVRYSDPANINYDNYYLEYAALYWLRNYWKAVYLFEYEYRKNKYISLSSNHNVLSLGAGPAADVVAYMVWLSLQHSSAGKKIVVTLLDKRANQLKLAKKIIAAVIPYLPGLEFEFRYVVKDISNWDSKHDYYDIIFMGHFLTANVSKLSDILNLSVLLAKSDGDILVLERQKDPIWRNAIEMFAHLGLSCYSTGIDDTKLKMLLESLPEKTIDSSMTPQYLKSKVPKTKSHIDIVSNYFKSWRLQTENFLEDIFLEKAVFVEKPGLEPSIQGIEGIRNYWRINPMLQNNINLWCRDVAYSDYNIICAFEGDFNTPKKHISIRGALCFHIDTYYQKVVSLHAYFGTSKELLK